MCWLRWMPALYFILFFFSYNSFINLLWWSIVRSWMVGCILFLFECWNFDERQKCKWLDEWWIWRKFREPKSMPEWGNISSWWSSSYSGTHLILLVRRILCTAKESIMFWLSIRKDFSRHTTIHFFGAKSFNVHILLPVCHFRSPSPAPHPSDRVSHFSRRPFSSENFPSSALFTFIPFSDIWKLPPVSFWRCVALAEHNHGHNSIFMLANDRTHHFKI